MFRRKFKKDSGKIGALGAHRHMRECILDINFNRPMVVIDSMSVYHFVDPDLRVEMIFRKKGSAENGETDFERVDIDTSAHWD